MNLNSSLMRLELIEFYKTPDGDVMFKQHGQPVMQLFPGNREMIQELLEVIRTRYPQAFAALAELYTRSEPNREQYEFNIVSRFIRCNFGEYNLNTPDIDIDGFFRFEEVGCPLRGECRYEGCICKPKLDTKLTTRELEVLEHIARGEQAQEISDALYISPTTVNRHRENIKAKLGLRTIAQLVGYYFNNIKEKE